MGTAEQHTEYDAAGRTGRARRRSLDRVDTGSILERAREIATGGDAAEVDD
jgi:hypothetical protein